MTIFTFGSSLLHAAQVDFTLVPLTAQSPKSAFNSFSVTSGPTTEYWHVLMTIAAGEEATWRALMAMIFQMRGGRNKLRIYNPAATAIRGAGGASSTINVQTTGAAGDETLALKNLTVSQAVALAAGDFIGIGENLHMVTADASSDSSGNASVSILPALRLGVAVDDPVNLASATGLFRLMSTPSIPIVPGKISQPVQLEFMEDPDLG